jgi:hypothetical protein
MEARPTKACPTKACPTEARPTGAIKAKQELGETKGIPKPELGNEDKKPVAVFGGGGRKCWGSPFVMGEWKGD